MRLTSTELLNKVEELRKQEKTNSEICRECGYTSTKTDGSERLNFTDFYTALLEAKDDTLPQEDEEWEYTHEDIDENNEELMQLYNDLCEEYDQDVIDEFIDYWTVDDLSYFKDVMTSKCRPDYIKCIQHTRVDLQKTSWCGEKLSSFDWVFQDIDHAVYSVQSGSRNIPCPDCLNKIYEVLKND